MVIKINNNVHMSKTIKNMLSYESSYQTLTPNMPLIHESVAYCVLSAATTDITFNFEASFDPPNFVGFVELR